MLALLVDACTARDQLQREGQRFVPCKRARPPLWVVRCTGLVPRVLGIRNINCGQFAPRPALAKKALLPAKARQNSTYARVRFSLTHHHNHKQTSSLILFPCNRKQFTFTVSFDFYYATFQKSSSLRDHVFSAIASTSPRHFSTTARGGKKSSRKITWEISAPRPRLPFSVNTALLSGFKNLLP
jgi:hypothetical protein